MQDIGGCRAIVQDVGAVRRVQRRLENRRGDNPKVKDYIADPKPSGYRGVHVIVGYDGRHIELQLRTQIQHEWAYTVEIIGARTGYDLKSGRGPVEWLEFFQMASDLMDQDANGIVVSEEARLELTRRRERALALEQHQAQGAQQ